MDLIIEFIKYVYHHVPIVALFLVAVCIAFYIGLKISTYMSRFKHTENKVRDLPCEHHNGHIHEIKGQVTVLQDIKDSVRKIEEYIMRKDSTAIDMLLRKCSPYQITVYGEKMIDISGGRDCVDLNLQFFLEKIAEKNPLVALDVEQYALSVLNDNVKSEFFNNIKNFVFSSPEKIKLTDDLGNEADIPVSFETVLVLMSIYLRDKYFEIHPEIDIKNFFDKTTN